MKKILLSMIAILTVSASSWAAETNSHEPAAMSHEMMQNNASTANQSMAEMHKNMINAGPCSTNETAKSFSAMSEHEKAAAVHETVNNGQSSSGHQQQAEQHRRQLAVN